MSLCNANEQLLGLLQPFSHGKWAHLNLNRIALFGRNLKHALSQAQRERLQDSIDFYHEKTFAAIVAIIENLKKTSVEPSMIESLSVHAEKLSTFLKTLQSNESPTSAEINRFERIIPLHVDEILHAFRAIRQELFVDLRCRPSEIIAKMASERQDLLEQKRIRVLNNIALDQPSVVISAAAFSKVFRAVFDFFIQQTVPNKSRLISLNARTYLDRWFLEISDSEILLPPERWFTLFDVQAKDSQLAETADILQKHEGDVSVKESVPDKGTTILIRLKLG